MRKIFLAFLAMSMMISLGILVKDINGETNLFKLNLKQNNKHHCVVDINNNGYLKCLVQPNIVGLYLRFLVDDTTEILQYKIEGLDMIASQVNKKKVWEALGYEGILKKNKKYNYIPLNLDIKCSCDNINKYNVDFGKVIIYKNNQYFAEIDISIVNSKSLLRTL